MQLVLASSSRWRRKLLSDAGIDAICRDPGDVEQRAVSGDPHALAAARAELKAAAIAERYPQSWVLGCDQVAHQDGVTFGKPRDPDDHLLRLRSMRGCVHELVTGWTLLGPGEAARGVVVTRMHVRADLTDAELVAYRDSGEGSGCAGGYAAEGQGGFLFSRIDGDWSNVIGLPLADVIGALRVRGWRYGVPWTT